MKNLYSEHEANTYITRYPEVTPELALRVYTSQLIGREEDLVLHGGGNTSVKARVKNILGEEVEVLFIKGSGWDLATIEPAGFPALDLAYLRKLRALPGLSDEEMGNQFRTHLLDAASPNPSIETLVHAFLPHKFIDHSHADAIVALTNQREADKHLRAALGEKIGVLPFIMPGFPLAKQVIELYEQNPELECIILKNHGIFTFGDDGATAYARMIHYVSLAENYLAQGLATAASVAVQAATPPDPLVVLPLVRGALSFVDAATSSSACRQQTMHLHWRRDAELVAELDRVDARSVLVSGVLTPDHVIRTKNLPLWLDFSRCTTEQEIRALIRAEVTAYQQMYERYFTTQCAVKGVERTMLDSLPRVVLVRGLGLITVGATPKDARIAADIAHHTVTTKLKAAAIGEYQQLDDSAIFAMEYWELEQVKLGKRKPLPLQGRIALVTGGGGAIAVGIGRKLLAAGARLILADIDAHRLALVEEKLAREFQSSLVSSVVMDVTSEASISAALATVITSCGGLDILVPNAGVAHVAPLAELNDETFKRVADVNMFGVFRVIKLAVPIFTRQAFGGHIIINSSKNVFDPGASFGAYSASKAGAHQLGKIAALELAPLGVRVNMINADAIFSDGEVASGLWEVVGPERMRARNLDPAGLRDYYRERNLLKTEVHADHVGNAVVFFASDQTPTTGATLPVDGGIAAAFPR